MGSDRAEFGAHTLMPGFGVSPALSFPFLWVHTSLASWSPGVPPVAPDLYPFLVCSGQQETESHWSPLGYRPITGAERRPELGHVPSPGVGSMPCEPHGFSEVQAAGVKLMPGKGPCSPLTFPAGPLLFMPFLLPARPITPPVCFAAWPFPHPHVQVVVSLLLGVCYLEGLCLFLCLSL